MGEALHPSHRVSWGAMKPVFLIEFHPASDVARGSRGDGGQLRQEPTAAAPGLSTNQQMDEGPLDDAIR
jgi:hypothetical protein